MPNTLFTEPGGFPMKDTYNGSSVSSNCRLLALGFKGDVETKRGLL